MTERGVVPPAGKNEEEVAAARGEERGEERGEDVGETRTCGWKAEPIIGEA